MLFCLLLLYFGCTIVYSTRVFHYVGNSHYDFGFQMGKEFKISIQARIQADKHLNLNILPLYNTSAGKNIYDMYLTNNAKKFPDFVLELRGIAMGSEIAFEVIFLMNIKEEFQGAMNHYAPSNPKTWMSATMHCSDIVVCAEQERCFVGHNEDSDISDLGHTALIIAKIDQWPSFAAYTYLGDLPSGAFGYNEAGIAFTLNYVEPADTEIGGLGRGFISRSLLEASSYEDAISRITVKGQACGHNYQIMDIQNKRVSNVEVASFGRFSINEFRKGSSAFFHANQYQLLQIDQPPYASSIFRIQRYEVMPPPKNVQDIRRILGDQKNTDYPIFHDEVTLNHGMKQDDHIGWTLITAIFDLNDQYANLLKGNPKQNNVSMRLNLQDPFQYNFASSTPK